MALAGKFVTRVIYLEEPEAACRWPKRPTSNRSSRRPRGKTRSNVAHDLGRPMAIVRMGGRVPDLTGEDETFMYGSPPMLKWTPRTSNRIRG